MQFQTIPIIRIFDEAKASEKTGTGLIPDRIEKNSSIVENRDAQSTTR